MTARLSRLRRLPPVECNALAAGRTLLDVLGLGRALTERSAHSMHPENSETPTP